METLKVYEESPNTLVKMKKGPGRPKKSEAIIKDVYETYRAERIKSSTIPIAKNTVGAILKDFNSPYRLKNGTNNRVVIYKI